ncbi:MAG TPA: alkaline phosphatase family protein [Candidatus Omnitrophota bacterium]|nr:alkaline phosphatase family protein [Candidatus Omnitrophota bacterium]
MTLKKIRSILFLALFTALAGRLFAGTPPSPETTKGPLPDSQVLLIFVDSLRPDIVDLMVEKGRLPNIKKFFYDKGLRFQNFFSTFPSLTVNAYTCLITGKRPDQSGLKAQSLFERFPTRKKNIMKRMFFIPEKFPRYFNMLTNVEKAPAVLKQNKAKALYDYLGEKYHTALVPVSPSAIPWAWPHVASNEVDHAYFVTTEAPAMLDDLNGKYAVRYMVPDTRAKLLIVWFTLLDEEQHRRERGQFDEAVQKEMDNVDEWLGKIYDGLVRESNGRQPYVILFSDHGAYGGQNGVYNQPYYIGRDLFYRIFKMNVRGPDYTISHAGTDLASYAYIDNMGRGQARIFLPAGDSTSGNWERPNTFYELTHYGLGPNRKPVDLVSELLNINLESRNKFPGTIDPHPIDLLFVKLAEDLVYVARRGGIEALIEIGREGEHLRYRYRPIRNFSQDQTGQCTFEETSSADPFGYLTDPKFRAEDRAAFLQEFHDDREWLEATYETAYPDAVTAVARALSWKPELSHLARSQDPDLWISAASGWNFRIEDINGADHGAILKDALRSTLMLSGPHIRTGTESAPHRLIDLTPTLMQLVGYKKKTDFDAAAIENIYENA